MPPDSPPISVEPEPSIADTEVDDVVDVFRRWLYLPSALPLLAVLGAVSANLLPGDPVWLLLVGPPGGGKTEILQSVAALPNVHPAATLTEPALLSGTAKKERDATAKGGLLRVIGDFGILLCKDFGSVLNMHRDGRAQVLAALREVYDGSWARHVGVDGGRTLNWAGKVGLVAGCTPTIDRHHAVMGAMGERFVLMRLPEVDAAEQARRALAHAGREQQMRQELSDAVARLFNERRHEPRALEPEERDRLVDLATLVARCRSAVERDSHTREIELVPGSEAPTRLIVVLERLLAGLDAIAVPRDRAWAVVTHIALDSMPALRRSVLDYLAARPAEAIATPRVAEAVRHPTQTTRRALEDLFAHGITIRVARGEGRNADTWALSPWAQQRHARCVPETSDGAGDLYFSSLHAYDDISGTQTDPSLNGNALLANSEELEWQ